MPMRSFLFPLRALKGKFLARVFEIGLSSFQKWCFLGVNDFACDRIILSVIQSRDSVSLFFITTAKMAMFCDESIAAPSYGSSDSFSQTSAESVGSLHESTHEALKSFCCVEDSSKLGQNVSSEGVISKSMLFYSIQFFLNLF